MRSFVFVRKVYVEILKITGSSPSVAVLLRKIKEQKLSSFEIVSVFSSLSSSVRDSSVLPELIVSFTIHCI